MKHKFIKKFSITNAIILMASNLLPFASYFTFAKSKTKDSIGSVNMEDNGITIGFDETQDQKTTYGEIEIKQDGFQNSIVYVSQASTFGVFIPKTIILDGKVNENGINKANYIVKVSKESDFAGNETINVIPDNIFKLSQLGKNDINATIIQDKQQWKYNELDIIGNGEVSTNEMSAGNWKGFFNFNILLESNFIKVNAFDQNGINLKATSSEIVGKEKEQLLNGLETSGLINSKEEVDLLIDIKTNEFENMATTTFDVSNIAKENDKVIILHFNETRQEWEYISTEIVNSSGEITTNMSSFSPVAFVKVNEDGSFSQHEHIYNDGVITQENNCTQDKIKTYTCYCGYSYEEIIAIAQGHKYGNITYTWSGYTSCIGTRTCNICKNVNSAIATIKVSTTKSATCTTTGIKTYTATFNDIAFTTQTKNDTIPEKGHKYGNITYTWNGYTSCIGKRTCSTCSNIESINATITSELTQEATCVETGIITYFATFNNNIYTNQTKKQTIPAIGHNYIDGVCKTCSFGQPAGLYNENGDLLCAWENTGIEINANGGNSKGAHTFIEKNYPNTTTVVLPEGPTHIGDYAFNGMTKLQNVIISKSIYMIGFRAFQNCTNLNSVIFKDTTTWYHGTNGTDAALKQIYVTNKYSNATYLSSTYATHCWRKK